MLLIVLLVMTLIILKLHLFANYVRQPFQIAWNAKVGQAAPIAVWVSMYSAITILLVLPVQI